MAKWWTWFPWILAAIVIGVSKLLWIQNYGISLPKDVYAVFPYLGIQAWTLMWTHYAVAEMRRLNPRLPKNKLYSKVSGIVVLVLILLHPGLLAYGQYVNGAGLPPGSLYAYVGEAGKLAITLGITAWILFLGYDLVEKYKDKPAVKKNWWLVNLTQSAAMIFIFIHALQIGSDLQTGWFRTYWMTLGILLTPMIIHTHVEDFRNVKKRS